MQESTSTLGDVSNRLGIFLRSHDDAKFQIEHLFPVAKAIVKFYPMLSFKARSVFNGTTETSNLKKNYEKKKSYDQKAL